ncbi:MAG: polyhydroxyalkanoate synthesis regulator DNA-binding domain-containing protein [Deltaproteobacteria bacterium]
MAKKDKQIPGQVIIKKYSNRRLYDSTNKGYVTLDDIAALIREGNEVKVIDSQTGADISKVILIQVVLESEKNKEDILPVSFLHMLIKYGNKVAKDFFENYFLMMFQPYFSVQENFKKNIKLWQEMGWFPPGVNLPANFENFNSSELKPEDFFKTGKLPEALTQPEKKEKPEPQNAKEVEFLIEKIKELEEKVKSLDEEK